jgi:hypothetical protein
MNFIIEGLTGSGKSQIIAQLNLILCDYCIISESETFGNFMLEIEDKNTNIEKIYRLNDCMKKIKNDENQKFILERFHFSYFPFINKWELYEEIDRALNELNFFIILLTYREDLLEKRALNHQEILNSIGTEAVIDYFGSKQNALNSYKKSHLRRMECLKYTKLQHIEIDTSEMEWKKYAQKILDLVA